MEGEKYSLHIGPDIAKLKPFAALMPSGFIMFRFLQFFMRPVAERSIGGMFASAPGDCFLFGDLDF